MTDMYKPAPAPCLDCLFSAAHLSPVSKVFYEDCIWPKDFEDASQTLVLEELELSLNGSGCFPAL